MPSSSPVPPPPPPPPMYNDDEPPRDMSGPRPLRSRRSFPWKLVIAAVVVVVICVGAIYAFSGAKVAVTPTTNAVSVNSGFTATASTGDLPFEMVTVDKTGAKQVASEGTQTANDPASGTITIYNAQSKPQELVANTRFATPEGLVFRIHADVKVPAGTASAPGTLSATAYADQGGEAYNIGPSTFTLPGLKGSSIASQVYAKSEAAMTGGFSGTRPSVSDATQKAQSAAIETQLSSDLKTDLAAKIPDGYVLVPGASFITYQPAAPAAGDNGKVKVQEKGTATAYVLPKLALAKAIAYKTVGSYAGQDITIDDASGLTFTLASGTAPTLGAQTANFTLAGNATLVWVVDPAKIAGSVAGKSRQAAQTILAGFPEVEKAILSLKPFWAGAFPDDPAKVTVTVETPKGK